MNRKSLALRPALALAAVLVLAACDSEPKRIASTGQAPPECASRAGGSRWASGARSYARTASYGKSGETGEAGDHWIGEVAGVVSLGGEVFVYDGGRARVAVLDAELAPLRTFGRKGQGPGELKEERSLGWRGRGVGWLGVVDSALVVFDGTRIQSFSPAGEVLGAPFSQALRGGAVDFRTIRLRYWKGALITSGGGYDRSMPKTLEPWTLARWAGRREVPILSLRLEPAPRGGNGVPFIGPEQAVPVWETRNGCVVASDGTGGWLVRADVGGTALDSLPLQLPDLPRPYVDREQLGRLLGMAGSRGGGYVEPSALLKVALLAIDPDGYAWILPAQDTTGRGGVEVVRVSLQDGRAERDTVPVFPDEFGAPGVFYARTGVREEPAVTRFQLSDAPAPDR